ncbi:transporter [Bacillus sp. Root147]|nr:transporter [Bacillus sp. Root147]
MEKNLMRGTLLLTVSSLLTKILGFIYIIPFTALVGTSGYALYKYAYGPYTLMLSLSTMGLPLAVSKYVSKYNGLGNYRAGQDLLKAGLLLMTITGIIGFLVLYTMAPWLAELVINGKDSSGNSQKDVVYVIRMVSFALIIIPPMSLLRGYFQGNQSMGPSALSTIIEQIVRVLFILVGAYAVIHLFHSTMTKAVGIGTFGAFIGGVGGIGILGAVYLKRKRLIMKEVNSGKNNKSVSFSSMFKELVTYAVPFVLVGLAIPIYQNIDTFTINMLFQSIGYGQAKAETINSVIGLAQILVMVPVSLATAFSMSLIPGITSSFVQGNLREVKGKITKTLQLLLFFTLPAAVGLCLLGKPVYMMIFGAKNSPEIGGVVLQWYAPAAILFALFTVTAAILQGINQQKKLILGLGLGIVVKIVLNFLLVSSLKEIGPVVATYGGYGVSVIYNFYLIEKSISYRVQSLGQAALTAVLLVSVMSAAVIIGNYTSHYFLENKLSASSLAISTSCISIALGAAVYLGLGVKTSLGQSVVLNRRKRM